MAVASEKMSTVKGYFFLLFSEKRENRWRINIPGVVLRENAGLKIIVDKNSHLMGALGVALLAKKEPEKEFNFNIENIKFETKGSYCHGCSNNCEIIKILRNGEIIDAWGNRCEVGSIKVKN